MFLIYFCRPNICDTVAVENVWPSTTAKTNWSWKNAIRMFRNKCGYSKTSTRLWSWRTATWDIKKTSNEIKKLYRITSFIIIIIIFLLIKIFLFNETSTPIEDRFFICIVIIVIIIPLFEQKKNFKSRSNEYIGLCYKIIHDAIFYVNYIILLCVIIIVIVYNYVNRTI